METEIINTGNNCKLSLYKRISDIEGKETILFIHGFGCNRDSFLSAFSDETIAGYNLIVPDLPGHGDNQLSSANTSDLLSHSARILLDAMVVLGIEKYHICAHSMGGLIGILMNELSPSSTCSFINLEGNLSVEDCTMTGMIADYSSDSFQKNGRKRIERILAAEEDKSTGIYLKMFRTVSSKTLHQTARETVMMSSKPDLFKRFTDIPNSFYLFGEYNRGKHNSEEKLKSAGIPVYYVEKTGHSMQDENPDDLYKTIRMCIEKHV